jgi:NAD(P)-dependent dehydrogenase (short-subunit alcohol dehydrogenase family)
VLVNNLGAYSEKVDWNKIDHDLWIKTFETNTLSAYSCMVKAANIMIEKCIKGAIVNLGSSSALQLKRGRMHYSVSKASVHTLTKVAPGPGEIPNRVIVVSQALLPPRLFKAEWETVQVAKKRKDSRKSAWDMLNSDIANAVSFLARQG